MIVKKHNVHRFIRPIIFSLIVYVLWESIGTLVSFSISKTTENIENTLNGYYASILLKELITFLILYILFHKKVGLTPKKGTARSFRLWILIPPLMQICDDAITTLHGTRVLSLLSCKGLCFFVICGMASLSIGLLEEYVWRGIVLNRFLSMWEKSKNGIWFSVLISSLFFGLCHFMNLMAGQTFLDTTKQVITAFCMGVFLAALFLQTQNLIFPIMVHGMCNFSNFLMNEVLGWNYSVWKYDNILQIIISLLYLIIGFYLIYNVAEKKYIPIFDM